MHSLLKRCFAEGIGTFILVFFAVGVACVTTNVVAIALTFGLVLMAVYYTIGKISGCNLNPAVSIALHTSGKLSLKDMLFYIVAQFAGASVASLLLYLILAMGGGVYAGFGVNTLIGGSYSVGSVIASFLFELIITFFFIYVVLLVANNENLSAKGGIIIGLALTIVHLLGINLTGTSVNPARSFGPALFSWMFGDGGVGISQVWVFLIAPIGGAICAVIVHKIFHTEYSEEDIAQSKQKREEEKARKDAEKEEKERLKAEEKAKKEAEKAELEEEKRLEKIAKKSEKLNDKNQKSKKTTTSMKTTTSTKMTTTNMKTTTNTKTTMKMATKKMTTKKMTTKKMTTKNKI